MVYAKTTCMSDTLQENELVGKVKRFYYNKQDVVVKDYNGEKEQEKQAYMYDLIECYGEPTYDTMVNFLVELKYSKSEENAILRKKLANLDTNNEFDTYNSYVEECKALAKNLLGE